MNCLCYLTPSLTIPSNLLLMVVQMNVLNSKLANVQLASVAQFVTRLASVCIPLEIAKSKFLGCGGDSYREVERFMLDNASDVSDGSEFLDDFEEDITFL